MWILSSGLMLPLVLAIFETPLSSCGNCNPLVIYWRILSWPPWIYGSAQHQYSTQRGWYKTSERLPQMMPHSTPLTTETGDFVLTHNHFRCEDDVSLEISGATHMAPQYGKFFRVNLEQCFLSARPQLPLLGLCFTDDIFITQTHGKEGLEKSTETSVISTPLSTWALTSSHKAMTVQIKYGHKIPLIQETYWLLHLFTCLHLSP